MIQAHRTPILRSGIATPAWECYQTGMDVVMRSWGPGASLPTWPLVQTRCDGASGGHWRCSQRWAQLAQACGIGHPSHCRPAIKPRAVDRSSPYLIPIPLVHFLPTYLGRQGSYAAHQPALRPSCSWRGIPGGVAWAMGTEYCKCRPSDPGAGCHPGWVLLRDARGNAGARSLQYETA